MAVRSRKNYIKAILGGAIVLTSSFSIPKHLLAQSPSKPSQSQPKIKQLPQKAQLTSPQKQLLKSLKIKVAVPSYIPVGFELEKVFVEVSRHSGVGGTGYTILYSRYDNNSNKDFCFAIESTNGGIGDLPEGIRSFPINSPVFGKTTLEYGQYGDAKKPTFLSSWLGEEKGPFYRFVGVGLVPGTSNCNNISTQEAIRVTQSLRYQGL